MTKQQTPQIRSSERLFYQKITDIYATAMDYSVDPKRHSLFLLQGRTSLINLYLLDCMKDHRTLNMKWTS